MVLRRVQAKLSRASMSELMGCPKQARELCDKQSLIQSARSRPSLIFLSYRGSNARIREVHRSRCSCAFVMTPIRRKDVSFPCETSNRVQAGRHPNPCESPGSRRNGEGISIRRLQGSGF